MALNPTAAYEVTEPSQVAGPRRAALGLAVRAGFSEARAGQLALVVSELATNLAKHTTGGELILRELRGASAGVPVEGIEILAIDRGPGMPDFAISRTDGHSTTGTLGHGLGAIQRQSDFFQVYTHPSGTVAVARLGRERPPGAASRYEVGAVHVSVAGEDVCGDDWDWRAREDRLALMVADGLGHGPAAHEAARQAVAVFHRSHEATPREVVQLAHAALRPTRGAALAMLAIDVERGLARYAGVGNISAVMLHAAGTRQSLVSQNGTAGHMMPRLQEYMYPVAPGTMIVMHSDGLATHWDLAPYPGITSRHPSIVAGLLYRDFSRKRDDVTVVVVRERQPAARAEGTQNAEKL